ncbi:MAG: hypothetical protein M3069_29550 [Chloroflexota bacterium]|nr:hypothetical protein [Chloroflexota bacterium]
MSESVDLVAALLQAGTGAREELLRGADHAALESAVAQLGHRREPAAAEVLGLVELVVDDRGLKKAARRELHRLRSMGVHIPEPRQVSVLEPKSGSPEPPLEVTEAWATDIDPGGLRAVWLLGERRLGGVWFAATLLNELRGLQELSLVDTTRKRFLREFEANRVSAGTWVSLPGEYALRLVREAVDISREQGAALPTRYRAMRDVFGEAPGPPDRGLVYETISPVEANFNPDWLEDSPRLLAEPEVAGWYVPVPADLRARALEVAAGSSATLLVPGRAPEQQALQLLAEAAQQALTPSVRRAVRRRIEETGYIFVATDRLPAARLAVAAARALDEGIGSVPPERHPLLRLLLASGLARLTGSETVGGRAAGEVLLELVERAIQRETQAGDPAETRPSGLIIPR